MRATITAIATTFAAALALVGIFVFIGDFMFQGGQPTRSYLAFTTYTGVPILLLVYFYTSRAAKQENSWAWRLSDSLKPTWPNSIAARSFLIVMIAGLLLAASVVLIFHFEGNSRFLERAVFDPSWYFRKYFYMFWFSILVAAVGFTGAFYYKQTYYRLVAWLKDA